MCEAAALQTHSLYAAHQDVLTVLTEYSCSNHLEVDDSQHLPPSPLRASAGCHVSSAGGRAAGFGAPDTLAEHDSDEGAVGASTGLSLLAHSLADLSRILGAKLEPFAIGPVSHAVAKELAALPQQGSRGGAGPGGEVVDGAGAAGAGFPVGQLGGSAAGAAGSIGLVLIDRSLDLATPCMHTDHVLDAVFASLPRADAIVAPPGADMAAADRASLR